MNKLHPLKGIAAAITAITLTAASATAATIIEITEVGGQTTFSMSGTLDTSGLSSFAALGGAGFGPAANYTDIGALADNNDVRFLGGINAIPQTPLFIGFTFSSTGGWTNSSNSYDLDTDLVLSPNSGNTLFFNNVANAAGLSGGTWSFTLNDTVANLGFTAGSTGIFTNPNNSDTITINVSVVPEPTSSALLGLGGIALLLRRRK